MRKLSILILSLIIAVSLGIIIYKSYLYHKDKSVYLEIQKYKPNIADFKEESTVNQEEMKLLNINSDYKFWISIGNTKVNYPVVQGDNNTFYLKHNFNGEYSISGTIFVDYRNNINEDKNIIIYGHNMKNGTMFEDINNFKDEKFFNDNYISIIKGNKEYKYEVFSVYVVPTNEAVFKVSFKDDDEYLKYLKALAERSLYIKEVNLDKNSNIITLATCSYEYNNARTIVHAKLLY
ncbi:class B sortase [Clostridium sp. 'White wine YQ']|uniref:class B sortase n=1 Tax=Clostridium sp. 'White wine YQ' TaxID=3027474 RepID=UPI0023662223|nr:class B sortase [Clostridium sp. 'White wine YQ']MDD7794504.1 class B sortase [Clostridium sp. 'White wine YQ']